ncbi:MAG: hypothetical protein WCI88_12055, partial [Chloroflexota bacterium]
MSNPEMTENGSHSNTNIEVDMESYTSSGEPSKTEKLRSLPWSLAFSSATGVFGQLSFFGSMYVLFLNE